LCGNLADQAAPPIARCLNGGYRWLEVQCRRCETRASIRLDTIRRPPNTPIWKLEAALKCAALFATRSHDSVGRDPRDSALCLGHPDDDLDEAADQEPDSHFRQLDHGWQAAVALGVFSLSK
jgi:hypothetical protein